MNHLGRLIKEQAAQALNVGTVLLDRVVLTGLLFRSWDQPVFELWSAVVAVAGLLALFELGFNLYVNNRLTAEIERGRPEVAERIFAGTNTVLAVCALAALVCLGSLVLLDAVPMDGVASSTEAAIVLVFMSLGTIGRILACGSYALYRANRQYARLTLILSSAEVLRILLIAGIVVMGGGIIAAALSMSAAVLGLQVGYVLWDTHRRFPGFSFGFCVPSKQELWEASKVSAGYFAQNIPFVLLTHLPVIALAQADAGAGALSAFVLVRTLTGLPRSILQALGIVAGQETGRRIALGDDAGAFTTVQHSARAFAVISGLSTGGLLAAGSLIGTLWTGSTGIFTHALLAAGLAPMLLAPHAPLAHNILASSNAPTFAFLGRWAQFGLAVLAFLILPIEDPALRMLVALAFGEIVGFAIVADLGVHRLVRRAGLFFVLKISALCLVSAVLALVVTTGLMTAAKPLGLTGELGMLGVASILAALAFFWLGLKRELRVALVAQLFNRSKPAHPGAEGPRS